jgi:isocitrate/isopropylmalate dehydrogenase
VVSEEAADLKKAIGAVLARGKVRTADLGGPSSTTEVTEAIIEAIVGG